MKGKKGSMLLLPLAAVIVLLAVLGPEELVKYRDKDVLNQVNTRETDTGTEGYRYSLSGNEKLYILSKSLNNQIEPGSEQNAMADSRSLNYGELTGSYAMVLNRKDSAGQEVLPETGIKLCNQGLEELQRLGVLPESVRELKTEAYSAVLYSAIDVPEPRNNVLVWKISLNTGRQNANRENRLLDAYVDADTGKIYEFYARTTISDWTEVDADAMIRTWAEYMGLGEPVEYEKVNPLSETTPYFKKYSFEGMEEGNTVVTIGFYEGINELFLKISR